MKEGRAQLSCSSAEPTLLCRACIVHRTHLPNTSGGRKATTDELEEPGALSAGASARHLDMEISEHCLEDGGAGQTTPRDPSA